MINQFLNVLKFEKAVFFDTVSAVQYWAGGHSLGSHDIVLAGSRLKFVVSISLKSRRCLVRPR